MSIVKSKSPRTLDSLFAVLLVIPLGAVADPQVSESTFAEPGEADADQTRRVTLAYEASYKTEHASDVVKNRVWAGLEYSKHFLENFSVQFDGRAAAFLKDDHRYEAERTDARLTQAYLQRSFRNTSIKAGIQTLPWGESIIAPITDEVSPRDNRELFNFNLEELRLGQPMVSLDLFSRIGHWGAFIVPDPEFDKHPEQGTAYFFSPFDLRDGIEGDDGSEYGLSFRKAFEGADITFMTASLIDNDYALRLDAPALATRVRQRFTLTGMAFNYAMSAFVLRGEIALKSPQAFNDAASQIVRKDEVDMYLALEYAVSASLTVSIEGVNQHIVGWTDEIQSAPEDRQTYLLSVTKRLLHDDLTIDVLNFFNRPHDSGLTAVTASFKWNDNVTLGFNAVYPHTDDRRSALWNVRDQKQIGLKVQYQF